MIRPAPPALAALGGIALGLAVAGFGGGTAVVTLPGPLPLLRLDAGVAPLAAPFLLLLGLLALAVALAAATPQRTRGEGLLPWFVAAMLAVLVARSVAAFVLAWEAMAIVSVLVVATHAEVRRVRRAAFAYVVVSQGGALALGAGLLLLAHAAGDASFAGIARALHREGAPAQDLALALLVVGFGSKAGLVPLHFWLPRAHPVAPASGSALLSGAMLKVALYGLVVAFFALAAPAAWWGTALIALGALAALAGILYAAIESDLKRLLAYSSIEHVGIVVVALGAAIAFAPLDAALAAAALVAALFHAVNHALLKGALFLAAGRIAHAEGTADLDRLGGLARALPFTASAAFVALGGLAALPPTNGFASEWLLLRTLARGLALGAPLARWSALGALAALALAAGLAVAALAKVYGIGFLGAPRRAHVRSRERLDGGALAVLGLAGGALALGLVPALALNPLSALAGRLAGAAPAIDGAAALPLAALLPLAGGLAALALARARGVARVPTWTCGSLPAAAGPYTASAFGKPLRRIFAALLLPERRGAARTDRVDVAMRSAGARIVRFSRRGRRVQNGDLRLYLAYATATLLAVVILAR